MGLDDLLSARFKGEAPGVHSCGGNEPGGPADGSCRPPPHPAPASSTKDPPRQTQGATRARAELVQERRNKTRARSMSALKSWTGKAIRRCANPVVADLDGDGGSTFSARDRVTCQPPTAWTGPPRRSVAVVSPPNASGTARVEAAGH